MKSLLLSWIGASLAYGASHSRNVALPKVPTRTDTMPQNQQNEAPPEIPSGFTAPPLLAGRPQIVIDAITHNRPIYYFGVGSNLSRDKLENRAICGHKIAPLSFEAAVVRGYRLAFNMEGFPPLEPAMGSLELVDPAAVPQGPAQFPGGECHGCLALLSGEDYDRVMRSEGVGSKSPFNNDPERGYEEVVVRAHPYGGGPAVDAVSLRLKRKSRLAVDRAPSQRYMGLILSGAEELGLTPEYRAWLAAYPTQRSPAVIRRLAVYNLVLGGFTTKWKLVKICFLARMLLIKALFVPSAGNIVAQAFSNLAMGFVFLPGGILGYAKLKTRHWTGFKISPMMESMLRQHTDYFSKI